jgi:hypothetical protein
LYSIATPNGQEVAIALEEMGPAHLLSSNQIGKTLVWFGIGKDWLAGDNGRFLCQ